MFDCRIVLPSLVGMPWREESKRTENLIICMHEELFMSIKIWETWNWHDLLKICSPPSMMFLDFSKKKKTYISSHLLVLLFSGGGQGPIVIYHSIAPSSHLYLRASCVARDVLCSNHCFWRHKGKIACLLTLICFTFWRLLFRLIYQYSTTLLLWSLFHL